MVTSCSAIGCNYRHKKGDNIGLFRFPADIGRRHMWIIAVKRANWQPTPDSRICGLHFQTGRPSFHPQHPDYAPSIFNFNLKPNGKKKLWYYETSVKRERCDSSNGISVTGNGQPSLWSDVDNIDWAPTLKMGYGGVKEDKFFKNPNRLKKPRKDTEIKRAIRMQSLIEKRDLLPLISNLNKGTEGDEVKKETQPSKPANTKVSNPKETNKKAKRRKKPTKLTKKKSKTTKSKQQPQRIERLVVPSALEKPEEKLTENPIIHRITVDCIVLCPPSEVTMKSEPDLILPDRTCLLEEGSLQSESNLEIDETICTSDVKEGKFEHQLGMKDSKRILDANDVVSDPDSKRTEPTWSPEISNFISCSNAKDSTSVSDISDVMSESNPETKNSTWVPETSEVSNESCAGLKDKSCLSNVGDKETEDLDKIMT